ncbi:MAG: hypothetical protein MK041_01535 [Aquabacterium sp.]|nr:hypothetical protein [Aquabacterium sp.]
MRVVSANSERVYDFGRYGDSMGPYGDGILRIWTRFDKYIGGENATGRTTTGYFYSINQTKAQEINEHYNRLARNASPAKSYPPHMQAFRLSKDYHAVTNNCTTVVVEGAKIAIPDIERDASLHNKGRGLSSAERKTVRLSGFGSWPSHIFMPEDLRAALEAHRTRRFENASSYSSRSPR